MEEFSEFGNGKDMWNIVQKIVKAENAVAMKIIHVYFLF